MDNYILKYFIDKRGRKWEQFCDFSYFDMICIRLSGETEFNSNSSFHFILEKDAQLFIELLKKAY